MAKQIKKKPHAQGIGAELVGDASELIDLLVESGDEREWAVSEITNEGPENRFTAPYYSSGCINW